MQLKEQGLHEGFKTLSTAVCVFPFSSPPPRTPAGVSSAGASNGGTVSPGLRLKKGTPRGGLDSKNGLRAVGKPKDHGRPIGAPRGSFGHSDDSGIRVEGARFIPETPSPRRVHLKSVVL